MLFEFVKVIQEILAPLPIFFELLIVSAILLFVFKKKLPALIIFILSFALLLFFSSDFGVTTLARPLEDAIPIYNPKDFPNIKTVVVLGGGLNPESRRALTAKLGNTTTTRLVEGIRIFNSADLNNLIVTGSDYTTNLSIAALMKQCAADLGVDESKIITIDNALNTRQEAKYTAEFVGGDSVFLVSSAAHLVRAKKNFEREGIFVVPIATDYQTQYPTKKPLTSIFPNPYRIYNAGKSIHEYLGLLYEPIRR